MALGGPSGDYDGSLCALGKCFCHSCLGNFCIKGLSVISRLVVYLRGRQCRMGNNPVPGEGMLRLVFRGTGEGGTLMSHPLATLETSSQKRMSSCSPPTWCWVWRPPPGSSDHDLAPIPLNLTGAATGTAGKTPAPSPPVHHTSDPLTSSLPHPHSCCSVIPWGR